MGFKISWIGFQSAKDEILAKLGVRDTGEPDDVNETPLSGAEIPTGWFIVFANDFDFASPELLASVSAGCRIVACQVHEGTMMSTAASYERGVSLWEVMHISSEGPHDLSVFGSPPLGFESIRQRLMREQDEKPRHPSFPVDHIFDIPVATAEHICGYRYGWTRFPWGEPKFTRLEAVGPDSPCARLFESW